VTFHRVSLLTYALVVALPSSVRATPEDDRAIAKQEYTEGTREFELGNFDNAIKHYEEAYRHRDEPVLLYNLAQAHRLAGHHAQALRMYKQYLLRSPNAANRDEVSQKITALEKVIESERLARSMPPDSATRPGEKPSNATSHPPESSHTTPGTTPPSTTPPETTPPATATTTPEAMPPPATTMPTETATPAHPGRSAKVAGIAVAALGVGALAGGIATGVLSQNASNAVANAAKAGQRFDPAQESRGLTDQTVSIALLAVGGVAVVAGAIIYYLGWRHGAREGYRRFVLAPPATSDGAATTSLGLRF